MYALLIHMLYLMTSFTAAEPPSPPALLLPVDCTPGETCLIQKLFDHDPGVGRSDYRCGTLTTNGHDGIDIRLRTMADMRAGVSVLAASSGIVLRVRDGEPDEGVGGSGRVGEREAGNAVVIDHGDGWETQYSHLRKGSLRVRPGQHIAGGAPIGMIGLSGNSEFPHLHFTVRHSGEAVDPFLGLGPFVGCKGGIGNAPLWAPTVALKLGYTQAAVISAGLSSEVPPRAVARRDPPPALGSALSPIILWVDALGVRAGDRQEFLIIGPRGDTVHSQASVLEEGGLSWFAYSGKRPSAAGWIKGRYIGRYRLLRGSAVVAEAEVTGRFQ